MATTIRNKNKDDEEVVKTSSSKITREAAQQLWNNSRNSNKSTNRLSIGNAKTAEKTDSNVVSGAAISRRQEEKQETRKVEDTSTKSDKITRTQAQSLWNRDENNSSLKLNKITRETASQIWNSSRNSSQNSDTKSLSTNRLSIGNAKTAEKTDSKAASGAAISEKPEVTKTRSKFTNMDLEDYKSLLDDPDFAEKAAQGYAKHSEPNVLEKILTDVPVVNVIGRNFVDTSDVNRVALEDNKKTTTPNIGYGFTRLQNNVEMFDLTDLSAEDKEIYNYLFETQGEYIANNYYDKVKAQKETEQRARQYEMYKEFADEHPLMAGMLSAATTLAVPANALIRAGEFLVDGEFSRNSLATIGDDFRSATNEVMTEGWNPAAKLLWNVGQSVADTYTAVYTGGADANKILGLSAGLSGFDEAQQQGGNGVKSILKGVAYGIAEGFFERYSLGNLNKLKEVPITDLRGIVGNVIKSSGVNASEEAFTEITNKITDYIIMGDLSQYEQLKQEYIQSGSTESEATREALSDLLADVGTSALSGFIQGGFMSGQGQASNYLNTTRLGKEQTDMDFQSIANDLTESSNSLDLSQTDKSSPILKKAAEYAQKLAQKQSDGKTISNNEKGTMAKYLYQVRQITDTIQNDTQPNNISVTETQQNSTQPNEVQQNNVQQNEVQQDDTQNNVPVTETQQNDTQSNNSTNTIISDNASEYGEIGRGAYIANYKGQSAKYYDTVFKSYYIAGKSNMKYDTAASRLPVADSMRSVANAAYNSGINDRNANLTSKKNNVITPANGEYGIVKNQNYKNIDNATKSVLNMVAKTAKTQIVFDDDLGDINGYMNKTDNGYVVHISTKADNAALVHAAHEFTHVFSRQAPEEYQTFQDTVISYLQESDYEGYKTRYNQLKELYKKTGKYDTSTILEEMSANATEQFLQNPEKNADMFKRILNEDKSVAQKFLDIIKNIADKLRKMFKGYNPKSFEAQQLQKNVEMFDKLHEQWTKMFEATSKAEGTTDATSETTTETETSFDLKDKPVPGYHIDENGNVIIEGMLYTDSDIYEHQKDVKNAVRSALQALNGQSVIINSDNRKVYFLRKDAGEYSYSDDSKMTFQKKKIKDTSDKRSPTGKMNAIPAIKEIIKRSKVVGWRKNIEKKHEIDAARGWMSYSVSFGIENNNQIDFYEGTLNVRMDRNKKDYVYDIVRVKKTGGKPFLGKTTTNKASTYPSNQNISQNNQNVNTTESLLTDDSRDTEYSLKETPENEYYLKSGNDIINRFKASGVTIADENVKKISSYLKKKVDSKMDREVLDEFLKFAYDAENIEKMITYAGDIAEKIVNEVKPAKKKGTNQVLDAIKNTTLKLADTDKADIDSAGGYRTFLRRNFRKITLGQDGIPVDTFYKELVENYPGELNESITHPADQLLEIERYINDNKQNITKEEKDLMISDLQGDIIANYFAIAEQEVGLSVEQNVRENLADAFMQLAITDAEKDIVKSYRNASAEIDKKISMLATQQKLIDEIPKTDTERINKEKAKLEKLENQINWWDKRLLTLEQSKPLQRVMDREKGKVKEAAKEYYKRRLKMQQDNFESRLALRTQRNQEKIDEIKKKNKESNEKFWMRRRIQKKVTMLSKMILNPTNQRHVPEVLKQPVLDVCKVFDFTTPNPRTEKASAISERLQSLRTAIMEYGNNYVVQGSALYDADLESDIKDLYDTIGERHVQELTFDEMKKADELVDRINTLVINENRAFAENLDNSIAEIGESIISDMREKNAYKETFKNSPTKYMFTYGILKPYYFFKRMGGELQKVYQNIREGENTYIDLMQNAIDFTNKEFEKVNYYSWDMDKTEEIKTSRGKTINLTLGEKLSLYALSKRPQAKNHIINGGVALASGKYKSGRKYITSTESVKFSESDLEAVVSSLTKEQQQFVESMVGYLSNECTKSANEVTMKLYGINKFTEKWYFPIKIKRTEKNADVTKSGDAEVLLKNRGFTKSTVQEAKNAIEISDFTETWAKHVTEMSEYSSFVLPMEDFLRVINYKSKSDDDGTILTKDDVKAALQHAYGDGAEKYILTLLRNLNHGVQTQQNEEVSNKLISLMKRNAVMANLRVAIQQPSSIVRAFAMINPKYFAKSVVSKRSYNELMKWCPQAKMKKYNYFDTGMGSSMSEELKRPELKGLQKITTFFTDKHTRDSAFGFLPQKMDELTWTHIWNAIKLETKATTKLEVGTDEFMKHCGERMTEVIDATQVMDSVFQRSEMMRSKSSTVKMVTAFMSEPTVTINMAIDAARSKPKQATRTFAAIVGQIVFNSALASIITAMRDDEDEDFLTRYLNAFTGDLADAVPSMIPYLNSVYSMFKGYSPIRSDMQVLYNFVNAINKLDNENLSDGEKAMEIATAVSGLCGIPTKNILRDIEAVKRTAEEMLKATGVIETPSDYEVLHEQYDINKKTKSGEPNSSVSSKYYDFMQECIKNGDADTALKIRDELLASGRSATSINNKIKEALAINDPRVAEAYKYIQSGNATALNRVLTDIASDGYDKYKHAKAAAEWYGTIGKKVKDAFTFVEEAEDEETASEAKSEYDYEMMLNAKINGDAKSFELMKNDMIENGKTEKTILNAVLKKYNEYAEENGKAVYSYDAAYEAYISGDEAEYNTIKNGLLEYGKTEDNVTSEIKTRLNDDMYETISDGQNPETYIAELKMLGQTDSAIRSGITSKFKPLWLEAREKGDAKTADSIVQTLLSLDLGKSSYTTKDLLAWLEKK